MAAGPRDIDVTLIHEWAAGRVRAAQDYLAGEEPLEIRANGRALSVTMRTPGHDLELAAGFLFTEGIIQTRDQILSIAHAQECKAAERGNIVLVELSANTDLELEKTRRNFFAASSCGICGKASIDAVRARGVKTIQSQLRIEPEILCRIPEALRAGQQIFGRTGGLHAAGLFDANGKLILEREDIGRHNAVDKIIGWALMQGKQPLSDCLLMVSGRGGFEIVQKAAMAGVPVVASVSACSSLAVQFAREMGMTLIGFLRDQRFVIYSGGERLGLAAEQALRPVDS
ncbi:MAG TPA: formate dehydrogenase accessory sulfurtransferase FdhD [Candidatus Acidoferrales bacterium]|nr:formate dehydrogenase accessory sulfurtransferase FdhD [Candidatus Acidoferrales bacterium]